MSTLPRVWLITGAASGFGKAMTERALENGDIVVATDIKPEGLSSLEAKYSASTLVVRKLDVTVPQEIKDAFMSAKETFGRVDIVFNNAGIGIAGELEGIPIDAARKVMEVNFWGASQVSLEAVRFFRKENPQQAGGRLLITSSMLGVASVPLAGYYCAAKYALEGFTESLGAEVDPAWNLKITLIEPGVFRTSVMSTGTTSFPAHPAYSNNKTIRFIRKTLENPNSGGDPVKAVREMYKLVEMDDPPFRLTLGKDALRLIKDKVGYLAEGLGPYESMSDDLEFS